MKTFQHMARLSIFTGLLLICLLAIAVVHAQDPTSEEIIEAVKVFSKPEIYQQLQSPDTAFTVEVTVYPCVEISGQETSYEQMDLIINSTGERQQIAEQLINCGGLGAFGLSALRWTNNSNYLYFTDEREGTPDGFPGLWGQAVSRFQIGDMQLERLGQAKFSLDAEWLAVWGQGQIEIVSAESDERSSFELMPPEQQIFELNWLPDTSGIIYIQAELNYGAILGSSVTHIDLETATQTVLLDTSP